MRASATWKLPLPLGEEGPGRLHFPALPFIADALPVDFLPSDAVVWDVRLVVRSPNVDAASPIGGFGTGDLAGKGCRGEVALPILIVCGSGCLSHFHKCDFLDGQARRL